MDHWPTVTVSWKRTLEVGMLHCCSLLFLLNLVNWIHIVPALRDIPILGMTDLMGIKADFWWFYPIANHMAAQVGVAEAWGYWGGWWTKDGSRPTSNRPDRPIITPTKYKHALLCISSLCSLLCLHINGPFGSPESDGIIFIGPKSDHCLARCEFCSNCWFC